MFTIKYEVEFPVKDPIVELAISKGLNDYNLSDDELICKLLGAYGIEVINEIKDEEFWKKFVPVKRTVEEDNQVLHSTPAYGGYRYY